MFYFRAPGILLPKKARSPNNPGFLDYLVTWLSEFARVPHAYTRANIIMIALDDAIIKDLLHNDIIKFEINAIFNFMSWNGFSKRLATKLNKQMTPNSDQTHTNYKASRELIVFL